MVPKVQSILPPAMVFTEDTESAEDGFLRAYEITNMR